MIWKKGWKGKRTVGESFLSTKVNNVNFSRFISLYQKNMSILHDYGDGVPRSMAEMHILKIICEEPGITVGKVAEKWGCTKGASSQNVTKLEKQGFVVRKKAPNNGREIHLYATEQGKLLNDYHSYYDNKEGEDILNQLLRTCSMEELIIFDKVLEAYSDILETKVKG